MYWLVPRDIIHDKLGCFCHIQGTTEEKSCQICAAS